MLGKARRVRLYLSEGDRAGHRPAHTAVMELLRKEGAAGAACFRGIEGFGAGRDLHVAHLVDVDARLPMVIEWVDAPARVERILPAVRALVRGALVTIDETEIVGVPDQPVLPVPPALTAADAMTRAVEVVAASTPIAEVVRRMATTGRRALPVLEGRSPIGIVTQGDLVTRAGVALRVDLLGTLGEPERASMLAGLDGLGHTAADVMTRGPVTIRETVPLHEAAELMARRRLKRLPVVDEEGRLSGILSRVDVIRAAVGRGGAAAAATEPASGLSASAPLAAVMRRDVPVVSPDAPVSEVFQAIAATRLHRALVIDAGRRVLGVISDAELLERLAPPLRRGLLSALVNRLPFGRPEREAADRHAVARSADELMAQVPQASADVPLRDAIGLVLPGAHKLLAVVDGEGRLVGAVDRADILRGLLLGDGAPPAAG
jgi:CBS domain-containing protein